MTVDGPALQRSLRACAALAVMLLIQWPADRSSSAEDPSSAEVLEEFFEQQIRPLLVESCLECHGSSDPAGGLRLDSREALLRGGTRGPAIEPDHPEQSRLLSAVGRQGDLQMPPDAPLSAAQVESLSRWIKAGAAWPQHAKIPADGQNTHWAFQLAPPPPVPVPRGSDWVRTPIDAFVLTQLEAAGLSPSPAADRRTLIRRLTFDLLGMPPTSQEVERFVSDDDPLAYQRLVDRLLASHHYGEKWGRHWLDLARYSDTKGYVYAREERYWVHAWAYRDWVVDALNRDLPYDRFLMLQIAGDKIDAGTSDLAAMGFLTLGRRFLGVTHDIIDDRIDVVMRGTMGLTVACARCHDHKYDPIPTSDYYALYGIFRNSVERLVPLAETGAAGSDFASALEERLRKLNEAMAQYRSEAAERARSRTYDYLAAQLELEKYPEEGFDQILTEDDLMPAVVRRWRDFLARAAAENDPVFAAWRLFLAIPPDRFAARASVVCRQLQTLTVDQLDPRVAAAFDQPPGNLHEVVARYALVLAAADPASQDPLGSVLYGPRSPCEVPDEPIVSTELFFPTGQCEELWKLAAEVDRWIIQSGAALPHALILADRSELTDAYLLRRGDPAAPVRQVPRRFLSMFGGVDSKPFTHGSGRLELARAIVDPSNPLTSRVAVNRIWMHHFGSGLVATPSDFGRRAEPPSHPLLLDWLANELIAQGWNLKPLHRQILLSAVYQQDSFGPRDGAQLARARQLDPENRLLWRMNPRRLSLEEARDAALSVSGQLDLRAGGKPVSPLEGGRRTLYAEIDRQFLPSVLRVFDFANPDLHVPKRSETTVPQQALFWMNHPFSRERSIALASHTHHGGEADADPQRVRNLFRAVFQREPTAAQLHDSLELVRAASASAAQEPKPAVPEWTYGFGQYDPSQACLVGFQPLPHFDGLAWQGGPDWPDAALGWVQLTAEGGHAGNDRQHAAVRRWTAPGPMLVQVESSLIHAVEPGDGVRGFLVSSRQGLLHQAEVHNREERFDVASLRVEAGETLDMVVDLRDNLQHEEFVWEATIRESPCQETRPGRVWSSRRDFAGPPVERFDAWAQLAQVLLCSNEFLFVD
jgi:hypothetical protein